MLTVKPLDGPFGAEILGLDLTQPVPDQTVRELIHLFHKHQVIKIRNQKLTEAQYDRFGHWFGAPHPHVITQARLPGFPGVSLLTNAGERRNGAVYWHTDNSYEELPASATFLHAISVPEKGGETQVADMYGAYDALSESMKKRIDGLITYNAYVNRDAELGETVLPPLRPEQQATLSQPHHKLVRRHPVTGRKALYSVGGTSIGVVGMPRDEALTLLRELKFHAVQPKYILNVDYDLYDTAGWDTLATLHAATPLPAPDDPKMLRRMWRCSVKGLSAYAQPFHEAA